MTEVSVDVTVKSESEVTQSCQTLWMNANDLNQIPLAPFTSYHTFLIPGTPFSRIEFRDGRLFDVDLIFNTV